MYSNIQTQQEVPHSISHSAFNVLNILMGMITMHHTNNLHILELHLPECIQLKQSLAPPPPKTLHSPKFSEPPKYSLLLPGTCSTFFHDCTLPQHRSNASTNLKSFLHFSSNKRLLMQPANSKCFMEDANN